MHKQKSFPLRISEVERQRARRLADISGLSENRLYTELIQEGLLMREQMAYLEKLREMRVPARAGLAVLDRAPMVEPEKADRISKRKR